MNAKTKGTTHAEANANAAEQKAQTQAAQEAQTAQSQTQAAADDASGADVVSAEAPPPAAPDENRGKGGKYRLVNGVRTLVERTLPEGTKPKQPGRKS